MLTFIYRALNRIIFYQNRTMSQIGHGGFTFLFSTTNRETYSTSTAIDLSIESIFIRIGTLYPIKQRSEVRCTLGTLDGKFLTGRIGWHGWI